ncbi:MAG: hypothetical protein ABT20_16240 [Rubrivivax sp. SCN 70-15]|nr:MAG: hypothetical protein ABT20_16240 [Rubrivivax sp. SCN 70-15]
MVFVWLFGFVVSLANACILQLPTRQPATERHAHGAVDLIDGRSTLDADTGRDEHDVGKQACKSFCDAEQAVVAVAKPQEVIKVLMPLVADAFLGIAAPAGRDRVLWYPLAVPLPPGPSVAIRFLRLTI